LEEKQKESAGPQKQQVDNKASGQTMQASVVNMVQQIMTGLSDAASEEERVSVLTKAISSLLKHNGY
jgi:hypothetical protein